MNSPDRVVLDTNVLSYLLRQSSLGMCYQQLLVGKTCCVACVTPEELYFGAQRRSWGEDRCRALGILVGKCEFLPGTFDIALLSASIRAARARAGRPLSVADAWIAATAIGHGLPLFSHDKDFEHIEGLQLVTVQDVGTNDLRCAEATLHDVSLKAAPLSFASFGSSRLQ